MTTEDRRSLLSSVRERLNESFGILSLSAVPDSILMWSHYAESHKGFALELDTSDPFFDQRIFASDPLRCVRRVLYEHERLSRALFEPRYWLRSRKSAPMDLLEYMAGALLLTKSSDWAYEQEWRMIIPLARARKVEAGFRVLDLQPRCILRVIAGSAMSENDLKRIFEIIEHPDFFHVEVRRAVCDTKRFRVVLHDDGSIVERRLLKDIGRFPNDGIQQRIERLRVSGPRYYYAQAALVDRGLIAIPPYDRSKQKKKALTLTEAGRARLAERRKAELTWEESHKSDETRLLEKLVGASLGQIGSIVVEEHLREVELRDPEKVARQSIDPEVLRHFAALGHEDEGARWRAAEELRKVGDANIVEYLVEILKSSEDDELACIRNDDPSDWSEVRQRCTRSSSLMHRSPICC